VARGMLAVNALNTIAWFEYGIPAGKPVLFVHGGPGGGTGSEDARYFDPTAYRIIIVDQVSTIAISSRPLVYAHPSTIRAM
jgi:proline iminopeptidase